MSRMFGANQQLVVVSMVPTLSEEETVELDQYGNQIPTASETTQIVWGNLWHEQARELPYPDLLDDAQGKARLPAGTTVTNKDVIVDQDGMTWLVQSVNQRRYLWGKPAHIVCRVRRREP